MPSYLHRLVIANAHVPNAHALLCALAPLPPCSAHHRRHSRLRPPQRAKWRHPRCRHPHRPRSPSRRTDSPRGHLEVADAPASLLNLGYRRRICLRPPICLVSRGVGVRTGPSTVTLRMSLALDPPPPQSAHHYRRRHCHPPCPFRRTGKRPTLFDLPKDIAGEFGARIRLRGPLEPPNANPRPLRRAEPRRRRCRRLDRSSDLLSCCSSSWPTNAAGAQPAPVLHHPTPPRIQVASIRCSATIGAL